MAEGETHRKQVSSGALKGSIAFDLFSSLKASHHGMIRHSITPTTAHSNVSHRIQPLGWHSSGP